MRRVPSFAVATALLLAIAPALADAPDVARKATAQALFDEARELTRQGKYAEACPKLAESLRLDATMGTRFYLADCYEHVGKLASAWTFYVEVADAAQVAGQIDREKYARDRAQALRSRLPTITVVVPPEVRAAGLAVERDGVPIGEAQWGAAIPVDLGEHHVGAAAPGKKRWQVVVRVEQERREHRVAIPVLAPEVVAVPVSPPVSRTSPQRIAGFAVLGVGLAGVGFGAFFGLQAMSKQRASNDGHCDAQDFCDDAGLALRREGITAATASTASFIVGAAALGAGLALIFTAPSSRPRAAARVVAGPRGIAIAGSF